MRYNDLLKIVFESLQRHISKSCKLAENITNDIYPSIKNNISLSILLFVLDEDQKISVLGNMSGNIVSCTVKEYPKNMAHKWDFDCDVIKLVFSDDEITIWIDGD